MSKCTARQLLPRLPVAGMTLAEVFACLQLPAEKARLEEIDGRLEELVRINPRAKLDARLQRLSAGVPKNGQLVNIGEPYLDEAEKLRDERGQIVRMKRQRFDELWESGEIEVWGVKVGNDAPTLIDFMLSSLLPHKFLETSTLFGSGPRGRRFQNVRIKSAKPRKNAIGRPRKTGYARSDELAIDRMHKLIESGAVKSVSAAAQEVIRRKIVDFENAQPDSVVRRLRNGYFKKYGKGDGE